MRKPLLTLLYLICFIFASNFSHEMFAQCPTITSSSMTGPCFNGGTPCDLCPGQILTLKSGGTDLVNNGCVDWYYSDDQSFDPYLSQGTFIACGKITTTFPPFCSTCPEILAIFIDACGTEASNEFMLLSSGSGFNLNSLQVDFAVQNNIVSPSNNDINIGASPCGWKTPDAALIAALQASSSCDPSNIIPVSPGGSIPANAIVAVFTSGNETTVYDFDALCANGQKIYVVQSGCNRSVGAFTNGSGSGPRTSTISLQGCSCSNSLTYTCEDLVPAQDGDYVLADGTIGNDGCVAPVVAAPIVPSTSTVADVTFTVTAAMCNMGPYYIKGILNPGSPVGCPDEFTNTFQFNVICPTAAITKKGPVCWGGDVTLEGTGGGTYKWSGPGGFSAMTQNATITNLTNLKSGNYFLTVTSGGGCTDVTSINITVNPDIVINFNPTTPQFCQGESTTLTGIASGGAENFMYEWMLPGGGSASGDVISVATPGLYTLVVTDNEGCTKSKSINVIQNPLPLLDISPKPANVCQGQNLTITASGSGGTPVYDYTWNTGSNNQSITVGAGMYICTVTDAKGCTAESNLTVNTSPEIIVGFDPNPLVLCNGGSEDLSATATGGSGTYTNYKWSTPSGPKTGNPITVNMAGTYSVTVTDNAGCTGKVSIVVTSSPTINVDINPNPASFCAGSSVELTASATGGSGLGYMYNWTTPNGNSTGDKLDANLQGIYSVTVTDDKGCTGVGSIQVSQSPSLVASISPDPASFCPGSSVDLTASVVGGTLPLTYNWSTPAGNKMTKIIQAFDAGLYQVTITDNNGCSGQAMVNVTENATLNISLLPANPSFCKGSFVDLNAQANGGSGSYTYQWSTPIGPKTGNPIQANTAGDYFVTVTDSKGCSGSAQINVVESASIPVNITPASPGFCPGSSVTLDANANGTNLMYNWTTPSGPSSGNPIVASVAGNYVVNVTDAGGCKGTANVNVEELPSKIVNIAPANPSFCSGSSVLLTASSIGQNLVYNWSGPLGNFTGNPYSVNTAGIYIVTVTETGACSGTASVTVDEVQGLSVEINPNPASFCNNGSVLLTATSTNGTPPFSYSWSTPSGAGSNMSFDASQVGDYSVTVTDSKGCSGTKTIPVIQLSNLVLVFDPIAPGFCPGKSIDITTNPIGGQAPYMYEWNSPTGTSQNISISANVPGNYQVTVTDSNGCVGNGNITVNEYTTPSIILPKIPGFCTGESIAITATITDVAPPYLYKWTSVSGTSNNANIIANIAGTYSVIVTNANACTGSASVDVSEWPLPLVEIFPAPVLFCKNSSINVSANSSMGTAPYTFNWSGPGTSSTASNILVKIPGVYTVTITDVHACTADYSFPATEQNGLMVSISTDPSSLCGVKLFSVPSIVSGGNPPYSYQWSTPSGAQSNDVAQGMESGVYSLTVVDNEGCTGEASIIVNNQTFSTKITTTDPICPLENSGIIEINFPVDAAFPISIQLNQQAPFGIDKSSYQFNSLVAGTYQLKITDAKNCEKDTQIILNPLPVLNLELGPDVTINSGETFPINLTADFNIANITWDNQQSLVCDKPCLKPVAGPSKTTTYTAIATDDQGCKANDAITIHVVEKSHLFVPNTFSPDGDGINDNWVINADNTVKQIKSLNIYDRWGESVLAETNFPPNDINYGWNGKFRDRKMDSGVFVYYFEAEFENGTSKIFKGDITLIGKK